VARHSFGTAVGVGKTSPGAELGAALVENPIMGWHRAAKEPRPRFVRRVDVPHMSSSDASTTGLLRAGCDCRASLVRSGHQSTAEATAW
jgi:hypothetical protein